MREIKFRAWDAEQEEMLYFQDFQIVIDHDGIAKAYVEEERDEQLYLREILLRESTGLHDKNGKEIWEGDIVRAYPVAQPTLVVWIESLASFALTRVGWVSYHFFGEAVNADKCEVLGNIHENGDLLK